MCHVHRAVVVPLRGLLRPFLSIPRSGASVHGDPDFDGGSQQGSPVPSHDTRSVDEEITDPANLSSFETQFRLIQREMVRVMKLPESEKTDESGHRSFKQRTGMEESRQPAFPTMPLDRLCVDRIRRVASQKKWTPFPLRTAAYFQFPTKDIEDFLSALLSQLRKRINWPGTAVRHHPKPFSRTRSRPSWKILYRR